MHKITEEQGILPKKFSDEALEELKNYKWTGNIRELRNVVERLLILGGETITEEDVKLFASK
jgi:DNA-binding NtrC family response regulator